MRPRRLFVYGTLRDAEILARLLGRRAARLLRMPAALRGFRLLHSRREDAPVLGRSARSIAFGEVLSPIVAGDLRRLGRYEGNEYRLAVVRVIGTGGRRISALAYLPRHTYSSGRGWDFLRWTARQVSARKR
jgi:gamma-glutamylcyclotransferase (GGCT)/AIG2-like uncharacterized protein YtfP